MTGSKFWYFSKKSRVIVSVGGRKNLSFSVFDVLSIGSSGSLRFKT